ncbi:MAG: universal stress protein [Chloroflexi bacterium]|nr:universal stress protein [Chloroflexota bacterium]
MSTNEPERPIRQIVVALDASSSSRGLLEAAAELAACFHTELVGLFIEDANLVNLAGSPFFREVSHFSTRARQLSSEQLERQLRGQANQIRRLLIEIAARRQVPATLRVVRGQVVAELLRAAAETDLIILGRVGQSFIRQQASPRRLGSTTRGFLPQAPCLTLVLQQETRLGLSVVVVYDNSAAAQRALNLAARLVQEREGHLSVILLNNSADAAQQAEQQVRVWLQAHALTAHFHWLTATNSIRLAQMVAQERGRVLVLPSTDAALQGEALLALLEELRTSVLVVR